MSDNRFDDLDFDGFRSAAADETLGVYAKIGFPDAYRAGLERAILADIRRKLTNLDARSQRVLDIGPGCSPLPGLLIELAREQGHQLFLADSAEMLAHLPEAAFVARLPGRFPVDHHEFLRAHRERLDAVLVYSVIQYVFVEASMHAFIDAAVGLLAHGGQLLIGDIPNVSHRQRFFASPAGRESHRLHTGSDEPPPITHGRLTPGRIDDGVLLGVVARYRAAGYHAYLLPQHPELPIATRREDLLIVRP